MAAWLVFLKEPHAEYDIIEDLKAKRHRCPVTTIPTCKVRCFSRNLTRNYDVHFRRFPKVTLPKNGFTASHFRLTVATPVREFLLMTMHVSYYCVGNKPIASTPILLLCIPWSDIKDRAIDRISFPY